MNKRILTLIFLLIAFAGAAQPSSRIKYNFNSGWKLHVGDVSGAEAPAFDDKDWKPLTLPQAWNEDEAFKKDIKDLSTGIAWYRKYFKLPASAKGQKIFIEFEGIRQAGDFYVNGKPIGSHENGITAFGFDITDLVTFDGKENCIAARIDNSWDYREKATNTKFQWEDRNFNANYGGIIKNTYLQVVPKLYQTLPLYSSLKTTGVYVYADNYDIKGRTATIHAESEVKNEKQQSQQVQYEVALIDLEGKPVATFRSEMLSVAPGETKIMRASSLVKNLNFWSWGYGYLYEVHTRLLVNKQPADEVVTKTGFRKTEFKEGMIYLNDRVIMVHGYAQRTSNEWPATGLSVPAWMSDYSNGLMVEGNGNLVRWMHITPAKQDVESCDRVGLMQAMPAGDAEADVQGTRWEQRKAVMRDAIVYNKNNPSIIFYECGNHGISKAHMSEMKAIRDQYDPHGGRAIGSREMLNSKIAEYGGEMLYTNKSARIPLWAMEYSRDEGSRKYWDEWTPPYHKDGDGPLYNGQSAAIYNRNMESHALENVKRWYEFWRERPGTGKRVSSGGVNIVWSETNTHHRGEENYRRSGEVDALRIKKQNFYANQVMWDGWVVPEKYSMHIVGHWNYKPGVKKDIYVIASAPRVALKINGRSMGYGERSDGFIFTFKNIEWQPGTISAVGYDERNKVVCTDVIKTAGEPMALRLTEIKRPTPFLADGHDMALIEVEVVDAGGNRCPTALNMVHYKIDGPGEWRGGMAMGPGNYILKKDFPVEGGVNRFLVRSATNPGSITITASADGLQSARITLVTHPVQTDQGLSKLLPAAGLPSLLGRGPTPATPSYQVVRRSLRVKAATAGVNSDSAFYSYDDNETTDWVNDGNSTTAWIEYELAQAATVDEISLKLNKFRTKTYPLIIMVDGQEVFNGRTQPTLGYYTIQCKPVKGKKIRIQLAGDTSGKASKDVEVGGKKLNDGVARVDVKGRDVLSIIEAEFYELVK
ncbi:sugar-binding domain-containing protein [Niabella soli]|uniref:Beta-galactosidase n=1 Tax=Niabella soli DSM 19437 TaxID=929713 RepID=W0F1A2_9BACT|nr:sugar-binding domain-containing protein [Niabella soli]AHF15126.1 beta-galactosidase [Niabella soli DSM 19437]